MQIIVENNLVTVQQPTAAVTRFATINLKYTDKSKQYQLKRMANNPWQRKSPLFAQLQAQVEGKLYDQDPVTGDLSFSSCYWEMINEELGVLQATDNRKQTGKTIAIPWTKKPFDLRDYQEETVDLLMARFRGVANLATGLGKTLIATHLVKRIKKKALIVCPNESVASQFYEQFVEAFGGNRVGFYGDGKKQLRDITVGIAMSVCKDVDAFAKHDLGLIIVDEVHHVPANTFYAIASGLGSVGRIYGLTATDFRSDGKDIMITGGCGSVVIRRDIKWGVTNGWLAEPYFIVRKMKTTGKDHKNDKLKSYKEHVLHNDDMRKQIEDDCRRMMTAGKSVLCLVDEVEHGIELAKNLGIPFATGVDSKSSDYVRQLNKGEIPGLIGTDSKVGEGTDTRNVDVLVLANFAGSKGPVIQAVGRGLRKQGTKERCIVLDYIPEGSTMLSRHGWNRVKIFQEITDKVKIV